MMVVSVIGFTTILGIAMLSTASLQAQATVNSTRVALADGVAESGFNLATYYLENRSAAPAALKTVIYEGGTWNNANITMPSPGEGRIDLTIARVVGSSSLFDITSIGYAAPGLSTSPKRTLAARVQVQMSDYTVSNAGVFNAGVIVPSRTYISGGVEARGAVTMSGVGATRGTVSGTITTVATAPAPVPAEIQTYAGDVYWHGSPPRQYAVSLINTSTLPLGVYGPTTTNPLGIYRYTGSSTSTFTLGGLTSINGTLIVPGRLYVSGLLNFITAPAGYPGLIVGSNIHMNQANKALTVNGLVYTGTGITAPAGSAGSVLTVNGAILMPVPSFGTGTRTVNINFDASRTSLTEFAPRLQTPTGVKILSWDE